MLGRNDMSAQEAHHLRVAKELSGRGRVWCSGRTKNKPLGS